MLSSIQEIAETKARSGVSGAAGAASSVAGLTWIQWLIIIGVTTSVSAIGVANYVAFVELLSAFDVWYLPAIAAGLAFFLVEGIAIVFLAGWISSNTRRRR